MHENEIARVIVDCAFEVHTALGPGLLEAVYEAALDYELRNRGLFVHKQLAMPATYKFAKLELGYRMDLLVENKVVVEVKSVANLNDIHLAQTLTYLRLGGFKLGILLNFNNALIKNGIRRVVNNL